MATYQDFLQQEVRVTRFFPEAEVIFEARVSKQQLPYVDNEFYYLMQLIYCDWRLKELPYIRTVIFDQEHVRVYSDKKHRKYFYPDKETLLFFRRIYDIAAQQLPVEQSSICNVIQGIITNVLSWSAVYKNQLTTPAPHRLLSLYDFSKST